MNIRKFNYAGDLVRLCQVDADVYVAFDDLCRVLDISADDRDALLAALPADMTTDVHESDGSLVFVSTNTIRRALGVTQAGPDLTVLRFLNWLDSMTAWVRATGPAPDGGDGRGAASYPEWVVRALMDIVQDDHERLMRALETMLGHAKEKAS